MPRAKKASLSEQREWLDRYDKGEPLKAISQSSRRAPSTVWKGIEAARKEREKAGVRQHLLREVYQKHTQDLMGEIKAIGEVAQKLQTATLENAIDRRSQILRQALKQHIPDSPLWDVLESYLESAKNLEGVEQNTKRDITKIDVKIEGSNLNVDEDSFRNSIYFAVDKAASETALSYMAYKSEKFPDENLPIRFSWGAYRLAMTEDDSTAKAKIKKKHNRLLRQFASPQSSFVTELQKARKKMEQDRNRIEEEVGKLLLRHMLPGSCELCPG